MREPKTMGLQGIVKTPRFWMFLFAMRRLAKQSGNFCAKFYKAGKRPAFHQNTRVFS